VLCRYGPADRQFRRFFPGFQLDVNLRRHVCGKVDHVHYDVPAVIVPGGHYPAEVGASPVEMLNKPPEIIATVFRFEPVDVVMGNETAVQVEKSVQILIHFVDVTVFQNPGKTLVCLLLLFGRPKFSVLVFTVFFWKQ
jgi:hypothetical protein